MPLKFPFVRAFFESQLRSLDEHSFVVSAFSAIPFDDVARFPAPGDNVAIACRTLEPGAQIAHAQGTLTLSHTILEGHRFALSHVPKGAQLLSWGLPFGFATRDIVPGDYVCNEWILIALRQRHVKFALPAQPNFENHRIRFTLDPANFRPGKQVEPHHQSGTFLGYDRGRRGVGTRHHIVVLGTSSRTASLARALAEKFRDVPSKYPNIDGVAAIAHTEGGGTDRPNNLDFILRTLAGFMVHANVAAVLAVDVGTEAVTNEMLREFMLGNGYPFADVTHHFVSMAESFDRTLAEGQSIIGSWLQAANGCQRTTQPLQKLRIALQCGGSDAFSGVSANPLLGMVAKELIRHGGSANLAETDELIGAEPYVLSNVRDLDTAHAFLSKIERFQERAGWHGETAEGNPSGGNNFRGLYNITVKSIGAARKKDPELRLDYVIDYAQPMTAPGFYFMDSPGNDLEGIAGQVAAGCNMIMFTTGNGSITNFPFVPTIKMMTNSGRYNMLAREMDVNAGRYLDGEPMEKLNRETFDLLVRIASGERSAGERVGFPQVQLWRDWPQTEPGHVEQVLSRPKPDGKPLTPDFGEVAGSASGLARIFGSGTIKRQPVGLILPTSLCASQVARGITQHLEQTAGGIKRFVALPHTEGCGVSGGLSEQIYLRTMAGYLAHPLVGRALVLEHGCEKTHNDAMRNFIVDQGLDPANFGWASIQLDGGLEKVTEKVTRFFKEETEQVGPRSSPISIALTTTELLPDNVAEAFAQVARTIIESGGSVVVPENSAVLSSPGFAPSYEEKTRTTIGYGEPVAINGLHVMETPTKHFVETLTGLGATGIDAIIAYVGDQPQQGHPLVPMIQVGATPGMADVDFVSRSIAPSLVTHLKTDLAEKILLVLPQAVSGEYKPEVVQRGNTDFQMTRGLLGVSL
jgi:altronate dehydratase